MKKLSKWPKKGQRKQFEEEQEKQIKDWLDWQDKRDKQCEWGLVLTFDISMIRKDKVEC